jgi:hypothetical protein
MTNSDNTGYLSCAERAIHHAEHGGSPAVNGAASPRQRFNIDDRRVMPQPPGPAILRPAGSLRPDGSPRPGSPRPTGSPRPVGSPKCAVGSMDPAGCLRHRGSLRPPGSGLPAASSRPAGACPAGSPCPPGGGLPCRNAPAPAHKARLSERGRVAPTCPAKRSPLKGPQQEQQQQRLPGRLGSQPIGINTSTMGTFLANKSKAAATPAAAAGRAPGSDVAPPLPPKLQVPAAPQSEDPTWEDLCGTPERKVRPGARRKGGAWRVGTTPGRSRDVLFKIWDEPSDDDEPPSDAGGVADSGGCGDPLRAVPRRAPRELGAGRCLVCVEKPAVVECRPCSHIAMCCSCTPGVVSTRRPNPCMLECIQQSLWQTRTDTPSQPQTTTNHPTPPLDQFAKRLPACPRCPQCRETFTTAYAHEDDPQ